MAWLGVSYQRELNRRVADIRARGEPLTLEDLKPEQVPDEENAAVVYGQAAEVFVVAGGPVRELFSVPLRERTPEQEAVARSWVAGNEQALTLIKQAAAMERCQFVKEYTGSAQEIPYLSKHRDFTVLLEESARVHLADGDIQAAFGDCLTQLRLAKHLSEGRYFIEALVDIAVVAIADMTLEEVFALPGREGLDLGPLAQAAEELGQNFDFRAFVIGERAASLDLCEHPEKYRIESQEMQQDLQKTPLLKEVWRNREKLGILQGYDMFLKAAQKPWYESQAERGELDAWLEKSAKYRPFPRIYAAMFIGGAKRVVEVPALREARLAEPAVSVELELHRRSTGSFPEALADVSLTYLKELPVDPFSGRPFVYHKQGDGYVLYSIGPNGRDDGGKKEMSLRDLEGADDIVWTVTGQEGH